MLVGLVAACSFKTVYNKLDDLIPQYVEGVVTLDGVLEDQLDERTIVLLDWHRNTQLKQYAEWLSDMQQDVGAGLTEKELEQYINRMEAFWLSLYIKLNDEMAYLLPLLDSEQRQELYIYLEDSNEEFHDEFIDLVDQDRIADYSERLSETFANWIGELTDEQQQMIESAAARLINTAELRLERRLEWQQGIRQILDDKDTPQHKRKRLRDLFAGFEQDEDDALKAKSGINRGILVGLTLQISHTMTDEQKAYFIDKTSDYIRMFIELAENR
ncbi:MAG: hypothetical protein JSW45_05795 [Thiotrichales bacterium]|nr:MAG: hypothetical protein JSW45_05795 [Thiotrichales bacterium]